MTDRKCTYPKKRLGALLNLCAAALGPAVGVFLLAQGCNLEVGNPDTGEAPAPGLHSITMRLTQYASCAPEQPCNSVPVETGLPYVQLRYELTSAAFALDAIAPEPFAPQSIAKTVELISEAVVNLPQTVSEEQVKNLKISFSSPKGNAASWQLDGVLVGHVAGVPVRMALPLTGTGSMTGEVAMPESGLEALVLDPAVWFDLANDPVIPQLLKGLKTGACATLDTRRCEMLPGVLSAMVERRIARSFRAQSRASQPQKLQK